MNGVWLMSYVVLWLLVLLMSLAVISMARQIGLLHLRMGAAGARMTAVGPEIGTLAEGLDDVIPGEKVPGQTEGRRRNALLLFVSSSCPVCADLVSALRSVAKAERHNLDIVVLHRQARDQDELPGVQLPDNVISSVSARLFDDYGITALPYAIVIEHERVVRAKGIVNGLLHVQSLLNALDYGHESVESFLKGEARTEGARIELP